MDLLLFDVDGTLTESAQPLSKTMIDMLKKLSAKHTLCLVSGGMYSKLISQIKKENESLFKFIFAENGCVVYEDGQLIDMKSIKDELEEWEIQDIVHTILIYIIKMKIPYKRGRFIDFRTGMLYISPTGGDITLEERAEFAKYDVEHDIRKDMIKYLETSLCIKYDLEFKLGGQIGIALHPRGWDKSLALKHLNLSEYQNIYFFGDRCGKDGNDYPLFNHKSIRGFEVTGSAHTLKILKTFL